MKHSCYKVAFRLLWVEVKTWFSMVALAVGEFLFACIVLCGLLGAIWAATAGLLHGIVLLTTGQGFTGPREAGAIAGLFLIGVSAFLAVATELSRARRGMYGFLQKFRRRVEEECAKENASGSEPPPSA